MCNVRAITIAALLAGPLVILHATAAVALSGTGTAKSPYDDGQWQNWVVTASPLTPELGPADEYFGSFKYSNLEVRNVIRDINIEGNSPLAIPRQLFRIEVARSALVDWADKYPRDPWVRGSMLGFVRVLQSKGIATLDTTAIGFLLYMQEQYRGKGMGGIADSMLRSYDPTPTFGPDDLSPDVIFLFGDLLLPSIKK